MELMARDNFIGYQGEFRFLTVIKK